MITIAKPVNWEIERLRLTAFNVSEEFSNPKKCWNELTGLEPDKIESLPKQKTEIASGVWEELRLDAICQNDTFQLQLAMEMTQEGFPFAGEFIARFEAFSQLCRGWLAKKPKITRLAVGAVLLLRVSERKEGYEQLEGLLPYLKFTQSMTDLVFQVNRPRFSTAGVENLLINRLCSWSVGKFNIVKTDANLEQIENEFFACRVTTDFNTSENFVGELPPEKLGIIFNELKVMIEEVAEKGDCE